MSAPADRRALPAIGVLLECGEFRPLTALAPRAVLAAATRAVVARVRDGQALPPADLAGWAAAVRAELEQMDTPSLRAVVNATGVVLHTNLGRAPLADAAAAAIQQAALGTNNLEYDLARGARGSRYTHCVSLLCELTGAQDAIVVNNCAAALVLALNTLSMDRDAVISRGELIEIGGSFRVPEIMAKSGARMREVGTTNRTHIADYRDAVSDSTGVLVKVHRSNFELRGFTAECSATELAALGEEQGVPSLFDFGSGLMVSLAASGLRGEPTASDAVRSGATLVAMSGDKLLGGPQAGILLGARDAVAACRANPLARALRVDKLTLAALEGTLRLYRDPERALREIPVLRMLTADAAEVRRRAERLAERLRGIAGSLDVVETEATVGGGAFPTARLPSSALCFQAHAEARERALRAAPTPVVGRLERGALLLDLRSVPDTWDELLGASVEQVVQREHAP